MPIINYPFGASVQQTSPAEATRGNPSCTASVKKGLPSRRHELVEKLFCSILGSVRNPSGQQPQDVQPRETSRREGGKSGREAARAPSEEGTLSSPWLYFVQRQKGEQGSGGHQSPQLCPVCPPPLLRGRVRRCYSWPPRLQLHHERFFPF